MGTYKLCPEYVSHSLTQLYKDNFTFLMDSTIILITTDSWSRAWFEKLILADSTTINSVDRKTKPVFYHLSYATKTEFNQHVLDFENFLIHVLEKSGKKSDEKIQCLAHSDNSMSLLTCVLARNRKLDDHFRGAGFLAHYVCINKLACRRLVGTAGGLEAQPVYHNQEFLPVLRDGLKTSTGFFKPLAAVASQGVFVVDYEKEGTEIKNPFFQKDVSFDDSFTCAAIQEVIRKIPNSSETPEKISDFIDLHEKLDNEIVGMVEEYVPPNECRVLTIDGFVKNGKIHHYSINENIYSKQDATVFVGLIAPARELEENEVQKMWEFYDKTVNDLVDYGLNNQFVNVEVFYLTKDKRIEVMEINNRTYTNMMPGYQVVYAGLDGSRGKGAFDISVRLLFGENYFGDEEGYFEDFKPTKTCFILYTEQLPSLANVVHSENNACVFYQSKNVCHVYGYGSIDEPIDCIQRRCEEYYEELVGKTIGN